MYIPFPIFIDVFMHQFHLSSLETLNKYKEKEHNFIEMTEVIFMSTNQVTDLKKETFNFNFLRVNNIHKEVYQRARKHIAGLMRRPHPSRAP